MHETSFEIEQWVAGSIEDVFEHFTVAEKLVRWHGVEARVDARPGGIWWCRFEDGSVVSGEIVEIDPPHRLVFTWGFETASTTAGLVSRTPAGSSRVEVTFAQEADGTTRVHLRHTGFTPGDSVEMGWRYFLPKLSLDLR